MLIVIKENYTINRDALHYFIMSSEGEEWKIVGHSPLGEVIIARGEVSYCRKIYNDMHGNDSVVVAGDQQDEYMAKCAAFWEVRKKNGLPFITPHQTGK